MLFRGQFLIHLEEAGDDVALRSVFWEAVSFEDGGVVGAVGAAKFNGHCNFVIQHGQCAFGIKIPGINNSLGSFGNLFFLGFSW